MKRINNNKILIAVFAPCFALAVLAASTFAVDKKIELQSAPVTIESKQTIVRNLNEIPKGTIGTIRLRLKWHGLITAPVPGPPTMPRLTVRLRHGSRTLRRMTCSSVHLNVPDKCRINYSVSLAEANRTGSWNLQISNTYSGIRIYGLDVEKGTDINPLVPQFRSVFRYTPCSSTTKTVKSIGPARDIPSGDVQVIPLDRTGRYPGLLTIRLKWHNPRRTGTSLTAKLLRPDGTVAFTKTAVSGHRPVRPRMIFGHQITPAEAALSGRWSIQIQNNSGMPATKVDVERDGDPGVSSTFRSTYRAKCP